LPPEAFEPITPPEAGFSVLINDNFTETDSRKVVLTLRGGVDTGYVQLSEDPQFPEGYQVSYNSSLAQALVSFTLSRGGGEKTVYAKFCTKWGRCSDIFSDSIIYIEKPIVEKIKEAPKEIVEEVKKITEKIKKIIKPKPKEDPELGKKEIRLTTVIDLEGYVYEKDGDRETRIPGAIVSIFWLNPETKQYELWPAKEYQQENPQITDTTGKYSFLVPEGSYYLKVEAPGYLVYDGKPFQVKEGSGVHVNIELKAKYWWLKIIDWKTALLILIIIFFFYNFYRDKIREKLLRKSKKL